MLLKEILSVLILHAVIIVRFISISYLILPAFRKENGVSGKIGLTAPIAMELWHRKDTACEHEIDAFLHNSICLLEQTIALELLNNTRLAQPKYA